MLYLLLTYGVLRIPYRQLSPGSKQSEYRGKAWSTEQLICSLDKETPRRFTRGLAQFWLPQLNTGLNFPLSSTRGFSRWNIRIVWCSDVLKLWSLKLRCPEAPILAPPYHIQSTTLDTAYIACSEAPQLTCRHWWDWSLISLPRKAGPESPTALVLGVLLQV